MKKAPTINREHSILEYFLLLLYLIFSAVTLIATKAPLLGVAMVLFLAPMLVVWQRLDLKTRLLVPLSVIAVAVTVVFQAFAYSQGIWYEVTPTNIWVFGAGPLESYVFAALLIIYFAVLYEYFFDDKTNRGTSLTKAIHIASISVLLAIAFGYVFLTSAVIVEHGFAVLVGFLAFGLVALGSIRQQLLDRRVLQKATLFSVAMLPIGLIAELVLLSNNIRIYAHLNEYVATIQYFGHVLPIEEIFLLLLLPMWIVVVYELCFDDGR